MSKIGDIAKVSVKGSYHLLWGLVISTLISSVGAIFIARLLGSDLYGLYTVVLTAPAMLTMFRDWGINQAIVRFTAQYRAENRLDEIRNIYISGIFFETVLGLTLSLISFVFAEPLAHLLNRPIISPFIQLMSISIFAGGLVCVATAAFTGYERMEFNSVMLICQSICKTLLIIILVIAGLGTAGAALGYTAGILIGGIVGITLLSVIYRKLPKPYANNLEIKAYLSAMLTYCLPLSAANIITGLLPQFYTFLLPIYYTTDNVPIGNYGVAMNFIVLITFFATPVITMTFPAFSKLNVAEDQESLRNIFQFSIKYASLLVVPVTILVMSLAQPAIETLFGNTYDTAALYLTLLGITYLYTAIGNLSLNSFLNGQDQTRYVLKMALLTGAIGFSIGYILIRNFGVLGLIATMLTAGLPSLLIGLRYVSKKYGIALDWLSSAKILVASMITGVLNYLLVVTLPFASWIRLIIGVIFFVLVVIPLLLFTRSVSRSDIDNLRLMSGSLGVMGRIIDKVLFFMEKLMAFLRL